MSASLRRLSGEDVARILERLGFQRVSQRGSHVKLRRISAGGTKETLHIPLHSELKTGTLRAIYRQACQFVEETQLRPHFYADA